VTRDGVGACYPEAVKRPLVEGAASDHLRRSGAVLGGSTAGCAPWMPRLRRRLRRRQPPSEQTGSVGAPPGRLHPCTPLRRPDPAPATFGYHEVFHLLVIAGVAAHFLAIGRYALPTG
jgi:hypothetical protein